MEPYLQIQILENLVGAENNAARQRQLFRQGNPFIALTEQSFIKNFRLSKQVAQYLIEMLDEFLLPPSRISGINKQTKVLVALNFFATGSYQTVIGNNVYCGPVSQATVSRCVDEVVNVLNNPRIFNQWVKFPETLAELQRNRRIFYEEYNIPGIVGVIDCTHIAIVPPNIDNELYPEHIYVNRKNYHSLNVQLICDANLKIINVNARYPGSVHDSHIWNNSIVEQQIRNLYEAHPGFYLIGDSGYPLRPWLQVPIRDPLPGTPEFIYNEAFKRARSLIERCNGTLKMRFRCLLKDRTLHYAPTKASKIVNACIVLHNICRENNVPEPPREDGDDELDLGLHHVLADNEIVQGQNYDLAAGRRLQQQIINNYFRNNIPR